MVRRPLFLMEHSGSDSEQPVARVFVLERMASIFANIANPGFGFGRPNPGFGRPNPGFEHSNPGYDRPNPGFGRPQPVLPSDLIEILSLERR